MHWCCWWFWYAAVRDGIEGCTRARPLLVVVVVVVVVDILGDGLVGRLNDPVTVVMAGRERVREGTPNKCVFHRVTVGAVDTLRLQA